MMEVTITNVGEIELRYARIFDGNGEPIAEIFFDPAAGYQQGVPFTVRLENGKLVLE